MFTRKAKNDPMIVSTVTQLLVPGLGTTGKTWTYDEAFATVLRSAMTLNKTENIGLTMENVNEAVFTMFEFDSVDLLSDGSCSVKLRARSAHGIIDTINNLL